MTTTTTTIADFILARLAEDEAVARACSGPLWSRADWDFEIVEGSAWTSDRLSTHMVAREVEPADGDHIARHDPARVLADIAAKRSVVEAWERSGGEQNLSFTFVPESESVDVGPMLLKAAGHNEALSRALRHLASVYADHADYDASWRP